MYCMSSAEMQTDETERQAGFDPFSTMDRDTIGYRVNLGNTAGPGSMFQHHGERHKGRLVLGRTSNTNSKQGLSMLYSLWNEIK